MKKKNGKFVYKDQKSMEGTFYKVLLCPLPKFPPQYN